MGVTTSLVDVLSSPPEKLRKTRDLLKFDRRELASHCRRQSHIRMIIYYNLTLSFAGYRSLTWAVEVSSSLCVVMPTTASAVICTSVGFLRGAAFTAVPRSESMRSRSFDKNKYTYDYI